MIRLSKSQVLLIHDQLISETGGSSGLRDEGILDSGTPDLKVVLHRMAFLMPVVVMVCMDFCRKIFVNWKEK